MEVKMPERGTLLIILLCLILSPKLARGNESNKTSLGLKPNRFFFHKTQNNHGFLVLDRNLFDLSSSTTPLNNLDWPRHLPATSNVPYDKSKNYWKWIGLGAFWWSAFFDHYQDAIQYRDRLGQPTHMLGWDDNYWYFCKNAAHAGYLLSGFSVGIELGKDKTSLKHIGWRLAGSVLIYWFIQNIVFDKAVHDVWFDYDRKYKSDHIVILDFTGKHHNIELNEWSRPLLDVVRIVLGTYLVVKY